MLKRPLVVHSLAAVLLGVGVAHAADPGGWIDVVDTTHIAGWACDADNFSVPVTIHFTPPTLRETAPAAGQVEGSVSSVRSWQTSYDPILQGSAADKPPTASISRLRHLCSSAVPTRYAYAINTVGPGGNPLLFGSPKTITPTNIKMQPIAVTASNNNPDFLVLWWITDAMDSARPRQNGFCRENSSDDQSGGCWQHRPPDISGTGP